MQADPQSTLDVIYDNWAGYNRRLQTCIAPLTNEQLLLQPAPRMWPLTQVVQHIISVRAGWFSATLQDPDPLMDAYMLWGQPDSPGRSAAELVQGLEETWAFIESRLRRWTPAECAETFPDEAEDGEVYQVSRSWVIYHVLGHDLHHGSEASLAEPVVPGRQRQPQHPARRPRARQRRPVQRAMTAARDECVRQLARDFYAGDRK